MGNARSLTLLRKYSHARKSVSCWQLKSNLTLTTHFYSASSFAVRVDVCLLAQHIQRFQLSRSTFRFFATSKYFRIANHVIVTAIFMTSGVDNATSSLSICVPSGDEIQKVVTDVAPQT